MSLKAVFVVLSMTAAPMGPSAASQAELFCRQLQAIVADAPRDFATLRGERLRSIPDDGGGDSAIRFAATRWLPGASACGVDDARSDGNPLPSLYLCWFSPEGASIATVTRIALNVVGCIGPNATDRGPIRLDRASGTFDMRRKDFVLTVNAEGDRSVVLAIGGK